MGKKRSTANKKGPKAGSSSQAGLQHSASITLREELSGKKQKPVSAKSMLKLDHIKNLGIWAGSEASIPSLGAFFGHRLAATVEALEIPPDSSLLSCQRCESILQPGFNCTVRIEKNKSKVRHRCNKPNLATQNSVIYKCHFCSHRNLKRGTPRCYMKELHPPEVKQTPRSDPMKLTIQKDSKPAVVTESQGDAVVRDETALTKIAEDNHPMIHAPATPVTTGVSTLLDSKRRKRTRPGAKKAAESGSSSAVTDAETATGASNKRKRKTWTSLKEIAERDEQENRRNFTNLAIPFMI